MAAVNVEPKLGDMTYEEGLLHTLKMFQARAEEHRYPVVSIFLHLIISTRIHSHHDEILKAFQLLALPGYEVSDVLLVPGYFREVREHLYRCRLETLREREESLKGFKPSSERSRHHRIHP